MLHALKLESVDNPQRQIQDDEEGYDLSSRLFIAEAVSITASRQTVDDEWGLHNHLQSDQEVKGKPAVVLHAELGYNRHNTMDKIERKWYEKENIIQKSNGIFAHIELSYLVKGKTDCQQTYQRKNPFLGCMNDDSVCFVTFGCHANEENNNSYDGGE